MLHAVTPPPSCVSAFPCPYCTADGPTRGTNPSGPVGAAGLAVSHHIKGQPSLELSPTPMTPRQTSEHIVMQMPVMQAPDAVQAAGAVQALDVAQAFAVQVSDHIDAPPVLGSPGSAYYSDVAADRMSHRSRGWQQQD